MPARSKSQQEASGAALAAKRGKIPVSKLKRSARRMYKSMSADELEKFAHTTRKGLPHKVKKK